MKWNVYQQDCPTRLALDRIADKWTVLIVGRLSGGTRRFGELRREVSGISPKVLTQKLRELERDGILTLIGLLDAVRVWAESHIETMLEAQSTYDRHAAEEVA
jgi:DNA-binding HxlR family transcriptional regulator